ncbi:MAG: sugar transporter substrate-binding protein [Ilumatobacteraceae bacterium]|nr:sugar transporter substrate-binding protein [Ilumatobacteraceae bacterium]
MKHRMRVAGLVAATALMAAACGSDSKSATSSTAAPVTTAAAGAATTVAGTDTTAAGSATTAGGAAPTSLAGHACDGSLKGKTVTITSSIRDTEAEKLVSSWKPFEDCTGVTIKHTGSATFEDDIKTSVQGGNPPDLAIVPQPGLLATLVKSGKVVARDDLKDSVTTNNGSSWVGYGTVDGKFYAPPVGANLKSLVWYNPALFASKGYTIPASFADLITLSDKIVADGGKPWCAGIESGNATGWPATDWLEEVVLSNDGPQVYDDWISNKVAFNDPKIAKDLDLVGSILKNEKYIYGGVQSIATTAFGDATIANGLIDGKCYMYQMANFFSNNFPAGTTLGPDGKVSTFPFPTINPANAGAIEGGGEFVAALRDAPEVLAVQDYTTSVDFANRRAALGGWFTSNKNIDVSAYADPFEKGLAEQLKAATVFRFDASDLMPSAVGSGAEWKQLTAWITGQSTKDTLDTIQAAWPS